MTGDLFPHDYDPFATPDLVLSVLMGGMQRAQERHLDKLNTIYVDAPQIENKETEETP